jgi:hypothetical protein
MTASLMVTPVMTVPVGVHMTDERYHRPGDRSTRVL